MQAPVIWSLSIFTSILACFPIFDKGDMASPSKSVFLGNFLEKSDFEQAKNDIRVAKLILSKLVCHLCFH